MNIGSILALIAAVLLSYLIGSIPTSFILARILKGIDIRQVGSGNVGATNVFRTIGKLPGLIALIIDILKGVLVVTFIANFFYNLCLTNLDYEPYRILLGFAVICGHIWSAFLKFRGGKGIATTIGVIFVVAPAISLPSLIIWLIVFLFTNYVSLASIALGLSFPIFASLLNQSFYMVIFTVIICILNIYKHKENIRRFLKGTENKIIIFKQR